MKKVNACFLIGLLFMVNLVMVGNAEATVKLPAIISDNMVLQSGMSVPVWGWASPGEKVEIDFIGKHYHTVTDNKGNWYVKLQNLKKGGPYNMFVKGESNLINIVNILVGEVWLASGQSNMEFGIQTEMEGKEAMQEADSLIRFFWVPFATSLEEKNDIDPVKEGSLNGKWVICNPEVMGANWAWHGFSAVGYYFAHEIRKSSHSAVGMIGSYKGGTEAQTWISQQGFSMIPALTKYQETHVKLLAEAKETEKKADYRGPSNLYNAMISPICPFGIRGVIWYQGESNGDNLAESLEYAEIFPRLIRNWRALWAEGDFPFLFVQLPNFRKLAETPSEGYWPWVREAQSKTLALPNTGMAVTIDLGDPVDIHPKAKKEVGRRLARVANNMLYDKKTDASGPVFKTMKIEGDKVFLSFKSKSGIKTGELKGFGIAGPDKNFVWAKAVSYGKRVIVSSPEIDNPVAVRYNWGDNPQGNLYGTNGLPASPFRTDNW